MPILGFRDKVSGLHRLVPVLTSSDVFTFFAFIACVHSMFLHVILYMGQKTFQVNLNSEASLSEANILFYVIKI